MKKVIICSIPMRESVEKTEYISNDLSLPVSGQACRYPVNSFLSQTVEEGDELKVILLIKKDGNTYYEKNMLLFRQELEEMCGDVSIRAEYVLIDTDFDQQKETHEQLMGRLVDEIEVGAHIISDITYGPKDLPVIIFLALNFAEKYLQCEIDNILYGKAEFKDHKVIRSEICDMIPLYCLSSVTSTIRCDEPEKARKMLKSLLSI